ncbi:hypothetical protein HZ994_03645 [Akkermansiaceae bacterium]|nr:hypothetical protein HZ994_03645 [Akkermansiaceae bacterium]
MKATLLALALITPAFAAGFDTEGFGQSLNGWKKNGTALYDFTDATYRTHKPTITDTPGGGIFVSTQVDLVLFGDNGAVSHIDMTFSSGGMLLSAQLRSTVGRKTIDTGMVRRPEPPAQPVMVEGQPAPKVPRFDATEELIFDLFSRFDVEMRKVSEGKDAEKRDLLSRFSNKNAKSANLAAGLRHNVNLMLKSAR